MTLLKSLVLMLPPSKLNLHRSSFSVSDVRRATGPLVDGASAKSVFDMLHETTVTPCYDKLFGMSVIMVDCYQSVLKSYRIVSNL